LYTTARVTTPVADNGIASSSCRLFISNAWPINVTENKHGMIRYADLAISIQI